MASPIVKSYPCLCNPPQSTLPQASLLCVLEEKLYAPAHQDDAAGEVMYPAYLVVLTSCAGLGAARHLQESGLMSPVRPFEDSSLNTSQSATASVHEATCPNVLILNFKHISKQCCHPPPHLGGVLGG